jgi:hypothetical protein
MARPRWLTLLALAGAIAACKTRSGNEQPVPAPKAPSASRQVTPVAGGAWALETLEPGHVRVSYDRAPLLELGYVFWGKDWTWGDPRAVAKDDGFVVRSEPLALELRGSIERSPGAMTITWELETKRAMEGIVGGGIELDLPIDPTALGLGAAKLAEDGRGFSLAAEEGELSVRFDEPPPAIRFEQADGRKVRVYLVGKSITPGTTRHRMTIRLPEGAREQPALASRYGAEDPTGWPVTLDWDTIPVDLRFLNADDRPAGARGPIRVEGDHFVRADGTPVRFWGTNVVAYALFSEDKAAIANQAKRIASFGFNLVRIHHHDSGWVDPNVFDESTGTTKTLRDASLDALDWWVKCLQDEGVYVWLDLHVGRVFTERDGIDKYPELAKRGGEAKGFNYLDPQIEAAMTRFQHDYLGRKNRYTGRHYTKDPGVLAVLVTNENDLTFHFGNLFTNEAGHEPYREIFEKKAAAFAKKTGLPVERLRETGVPGYGKLLLADLEARYHQRAIADLRGLGWKGPVVTTSYWTGGMYVLPSLAVGDMIDVHVYGRPELVETNPRWVPHFLSYAAGGQVAGKPMTLTEWNIQAPATDRFLGPMFMAGFASLQGWDAPMLYAYTHWAMGPPKSPDPFTAFSDPAAMATMAAAALAYRRGDIAPAKNTYVFDLDRETTFGRDVHAGTSAAMRTLAEQSRIVIGLPDVPELEWDREYRAPDAIVVKDLDHDYIPEGDSVVTSDTGEIRRDWEHGIHTIDTPRTQAAIGWTGGREVDLSALQVRVTTAKSAVVISSLDGAPIERAKKLMLSVVARAVLGQGNSYPLHAEPVRGSVRLRSEHAALVAKPLSGSGPPVTPPIRTKAEGGWHELPLPASTVHWYVLEPG